LIAWEIAVRLRVAGTQRPFPRCIWILERQFKRRSRGHETDVRSALEILATRDFCDLPFRRLIWTWSVDQISKLMAVPWQDWPLLKQVLLVLILAGVLWALYRAGWELLEAGAAILAAFAGLLGVLVQNATPRVF